MSKRKQTLAKKLKIKFFVLTILFLSVNNFIYTAAQKSPAQALKTCMSIDSNLPFNNVNHPCHQSYMPNQSWWSWLKGDSKSANFYFLDLIELLHKGIF